MHSKACEIVRISDLVVEAGLTTEAVKPKSPVAEKTFSPGDLPGGRGVSAADLHKPQLYRLNTQTFFPR